MAKSSSSTDLTLPQLQNLIKRDPESYKHEFEVQLGHYQANLDSFRKSPTRLVALEDLILFITQVSHCFPTLVQTFPEDLADLLKQYGMSTMDRNMRMVLCKALIQLRNKSIAPPTLLLHLTFDLARCPDKELRKTLFSYVVNDIKKFNQKRKDPRTNSILKTYLSNMLRSNNPVAVKMALDILIDLYRRNVWHDEKTVNIISTACFCKTTKVMVAATKFFLGTEKIIDEDNSSDEENEMEQKRKTLQQMRMSNQVGKKSKKKRKKVDRAIAALRESGKQRNRAQSFNFSALHLLHNPQGMAERLFQLMGTSGSGGGVNEKFEVKLLRLDLISRLVGLHQLILLNFYPYLTRFLKPHQREVTKILLYAAQASHDLVPPEFLEEVIKEVTHNFITERNSAEVMAVGLNSVREICSRCPLAMGDDLLQDLTQYNSHRDKNVYMAARSLIGLYRKVNPKMLSKKDRGRPTGVEVESTTQFASLNSKDFLTGADVLKEEMGEAEEAEGWETASSADEEDEGSDGWVNVSHSSEGEMEEESEEVTALTKEEKEAKARRVTEARVLTQAEFETIRRTQMLREAGLLNKAGEKKTHKRKAEESGVLENSEKGELVSIDDIERIHKSRKADKQAKLAAVMEGRRERGKYGQRIHNPDAGVTNRIKAKGKIYTMLRPKLERKKNKRSFRDKQVALKKRMTQKHKKVK